MYRVNVSTVNVAPSLRVPRTVQVVGTERVEAGGEHRRRFVDLAGHPRGILFVVAVVHGRDVLVPVGERRVVVGEHQLQPLVVETEHITHVAGVLECGPAIIRRPHGDVVSSEHVTPGDGVAANEAGDVGDRHRRRVESTLVAGALEHPGPVLRIGRDRHRRQR